MSFNVGAAEFMPAWMKKKDAGPKAPVGIPHAEPLPPSSVPPTAGGGEIAKKEEQQDSSAAGKLSADAPVFQPKAAVKAAKPKPALPTVGAVERVAKKTVDEVLEKAAASSFKVTGATFVPAGYVPKAPTTVVAAGANGVVDESKGPSVLRDSWSLYFIDRSLVTETNFDPILVFRMDSVEDFCKVFNNIPTAQDMPAQSTYYFFRADIAPKWEDARNIEGGCWQLRLRSTDKALDDVWERLCAQSVGEKWLFDEHRDAVNGLVLKSRNNFHMLQIWVAEKKKHFPSDLLRAVEEVLPAFDIDFYDHNTMRESSVVQPKKRRGGGKKK